ncbi:MAG: hypothetical protein Q8P63_00865, partial [Candidatus Nealsonbacteria bacterium]|nr:hypothetical protein [Candidatus Nealsonbacteria bacterium]
SNGVNSIRTILGLFLLLAGLGLIVFSLYSSFNIFTGKTAPPEIFEPQSQVQVSGGQGLQDQLQQAVEQQLKGLLPVGSITTLLNLISWSILAGILILGGTQVSGLGIKLIL